MFSSAGDAPRSGDELDYPRIGLADLTGSASGAFTLLFRSEPFQYVRAGIDGARIAACEGMA